MRMVIEGRAMGREFDEAAAIAEINRRRARNRRDEPRASYGIGSAWYCYRCDVGCDERARRGLEALGYEVWVPMLQKIVKHARKLQEVSRPLFPRHGFVRVDPNEQGFGLVLRCRGVESLISMTGTPSRVPDAAIDELRARAGIGAFDYRKQKGGPRRGAMVTISGEGPFRGWVAEVIQEADDTRRVGVLLKLFNAVRVTKISLDNLRE